MKNEMEMMYQEYLKEYNKQKAKFNSHVAQMLEIYNKYATINVRDIFYNGIRFYEPEAVLRLDYMSDEEALFLEVKGYDLWWLYENENVDEKFEIWRHFNEQDFDACMHIKISKEGIELDHENENVEMLFTFDKALKDGKIVIDFYEAIMSEVNDSILESNLEFLDGEARHEAIKHLSEKKKRKCKTDEEIEEMMLRQNYQDFTTPIEELKRMNNA
ncbi:hypothetical protein ACIQFL_09200 [Bacillus toyonensis]|uniref:hypothetical protein n=1 Tax=Bacillus toyonensis TaxID=155322 RepID=UPI0037FC129A